MDYTGVLSYAANSDSGFSCSPAVGSGDALPLQDARCQSGWLILHGMVCLPYDYVLMALMSLQETHR